MKKFVTIIALAGMLLGCGAAHAQNHASIDTSGLSAEQVASIQAAVETAKNQNLKSSPVNLSAKAREEVSAWSELGANMGSALVAAAKELGIAAADFANTPLGQIVVFVLVFTLLGQPIIGVAFFAAVLGMVIYLLNTKWCDRRRYEHKPVLWGFWSRRVLVEHYESSEASFARIFVAAVILCIGVAISAALIG